MFFSIKVLVAVDGVNAFWNQTTIKNPERELVCVCVCILLNVCLLEQLITENLNLKLLTYRKT